MMSSSSLKACKNSKLQCNLVYIYKNHTVFPLESKSSIFLVFSNSSKKVKVLCTDLSIILLLLILTLNY